MSQKKTISVIIAVMLIISMLAACKAEVIPSGGEQTTETTTVPAVVAAKDEIIKFSVKDSDENSLVLVPLFDKDEKTVIGGYILSGTDSSGNELSKENYPNLNSFVKVQEDENKNFSLVYSEDNNLIVYSVYADSDGNIVAFEDTYDIDGNGNKEEFFGISTLTDSNGITFYCLTKGENDGYTVLSVTKDNDGIYSMKKSDGTTVSLSMVNSKNNAANSNISNKLNVNEEKQKANNPEETSAENKNQSGTTAAPPKNDTQTNNDKDNTLPTDDTVKITLEKNAGATIKNDSKKQVLIKNGVLTISGSGNFLIDQNTSEWHGQMVVKMAATDKSEIRFENVKIVNEHVSTILFIDNTNMSVNNSDTQEVEGSMPEGPTQDQIKELSKNYDGVSPNLDLSFPTGTESTFIAAGSDIKGVVYNESKLTIRGNGVCNIEHKNNSDCAINSVKSLRIKNVSLNLKTPANVEGSRGIYSISTVTVESGKLNVSSGGDCIRCDNYEQLGGTISLDSNKADGIDASDSIKISGGDLSAVALTKSCLKVRAMNQLEDGLKKELKPNETFKIDGGKIRAVGYKVSDVHPDSAQASISADTNTRNNYQFTLYYKNPDDSNTLIYESPVASRKFFYSDSSIDPSKTGRSFNGGNSKVECYKVRAGGNNKVVSFTRTVGSAEIKLAP